MIIYENLAYIKKARIGWKKGTCWVGFSRQEYWSGLPFTSPGHLPDPGIKPSFPALQVNSLLLSHRGSPYKLVAGHFNLSSPEKGVLDVVFNVSIHYLHAIK